ncbi:MAG: VIT domain-containing protein [Acidobacteriota bacterium]|nr:VIT domain-containing protein [Acidobacteriota bacterium]
MPIADDHTRFILSAALMLAALATTATGDTLNPGAPALLERRGGELVALPLLHSDVDIAVTGVLVHGVVTQAYRNPSDRVIEAVYAFPLPDGASVDRMEIRIGTRTIESVVREKQTARKTYERAKSEGKKAALLETSSADCFTVSVTGINPGEQVDVVLEYRQEAAFEDGTFRLSFPLTITPRYRPEPAPAAPTFAAARDVSVPRASIGARIDAGIPLQNLDSPSHRIDLRWEGETWIAKPESDEIPMDRDFVLEWRPLVRDEPVAVSFLESGYGLLMLVPPRDESRPSLPTDTLFVVDVSGSMKGRSIEQAREALIAALDRLTPRDRFNMLAFNQGQRPMSATFLSVRSTGRDGPREWIENLAAGGGTDIYAALRVAIAMTDAEPDAGAVRRLVFLTDGAVGRDEATLRELAAGLGDTRLHVIGLGHAPNRPLLRTMAEVGRGLSSFVTGGEETANRIDEFFTRLDRPVLAGIDVSFEGASAVSMLPDPLPDLHAGEPLVVSYRLSGAALPEALVVRATTHAGPFEKRFPLQTSRAAGGGIASRWASRRIASLLDTVHAGADPEDVRRRVVELAAAHRLVTPYTSLVAVETVASAIGDPDKIALALGSPGSGGATALLPRGGTAAPLFRLLGGSLLLAGAMLLVVPVLLRR